MKKTTLLKTMLLLCALIVGSSSAWADDYEWQLVTDYSSLSTDDTYVIACNTGSAWYSLKNNQVTSKQNLPIGSTLTVSSNKITSTVSNDETWTLESGSSSGQYYIKSTKGNYYLYNNNDTKSYIKTKSSTDNQNLWTIHTEGTYTEKSSGTTYTVIGLYNIGAERMLAVYETSSNTDWRCYASSNYSNINGDEVVLFKRALASTDPSISASNVNIADDATSGYITYSISNPVSGKSLAASKKSGDWLSNVQVDSENSKVTFETEVNETNEAREAVVTLNYGEGLATKDVTITQAAATVKYTVTIETPTNGSLVVKNGEITLTSGVKLPEGTVLTITTTPNLGYKVRNWQAVDASTHTYTSGTTYTMTAHDVTLKANFDEIEKYTVTLSDNGATLTEEYGGAGVTLPSREDIGTDYTFEGWSVTKPTGTSAAPTIISAGLYLPTENTTLYPVYSYEDIGKVTKYQLVNSLSEVTEGTYVWTSIYQTSGSPHVYMPNADATSNPTLKEGLTETTIEGKKYLSNEIASDMLWDFTSTGTDNQYYIRPHGKTNKGFGCTTTGGDKIRIGSTYKDMKWTVAVSSNYNWQFKNDAETAMYIAVYDKYAWRNYSSATTNQKGKFYLYKGVEVDDVTTCYTSASSITITAAGWASFSNASEVEIPEGVTAYYAQKKDESTVTLKEITGGYIPANTGVVLSGAANNYSAAVTTTGATLDEDNLLMPWLTAGEPTETTYYTLAVDSNNKPVFKQSTGGTLAAGKAYLVMPASEGARELNVSFDEEGNTTAIEELKDSKIEELKSCFNLNGQRVAQPTKGLYIVNGRKVVVK